MVAIIILVLLALALIVPYNNLTRRRNQVDNAFGAIDAMLKKRFDLVPNLVATVQQYAAHEKETLEQITALRAKNYAAMSPAEKADFDRSFNAARRRFFLVAENYPQLRASENFLQLQRSLNEIEEQLSAARRTYNAAVTDYNNAVMTFPSNLVAGLFGFTRKEVLSIPEAERANPNVKELFRS